jgi:hypothetical protein
MTNTRAPMKTAAEPDSADVTADQSISSATSAM